MPPAPTWKETMDSLGGGQLFTDTTFPPTDASLFYDKAVHRAGIAANEKDNMPDGIIWVRCCQDDQLPKSIITDGIRADDINQQALGDCYFLCALSVLAECPERILKLLTTTEVNSQGCYGVRLYNRGLLEEVVVDDSFPCLPRNLSSKTTPTFSHSKSGEMWPMILEKAYAKMYGAVYQKIEAGISSEAFEDLTGAPTIVYQVKEQGSPLEFFDKLSNDLSKGYAMCTSTREGDTAAEKLGFVSSHAYGILSVAAHEAAGVKLFKIRNPWGQTEWVGDWSDKSPLWTEELKAFFGYKDADDGVFFMELKDFTNYFERVSVCLIEDSWANVAVDVPPGRNVVDVQVPASPSGGGGGLPVWVSLKTVDKRHYTHDSNATYKNPAIRFHVLCVAPAEHAGLTCWSREAHGPRDLHEKLELRPGATYRVVIHRQPENSPITLAVYSPNSCGVQVLEMEQGAAATITALPSEHEEAYKQELLRSGTLYSKADDYGSDKIKMLQLKAPWGFGFLLQNQSDHLEVTETGKFKPKNLSVAAASVLLPATRTNEDGTVSVDWKVGPGSVSAPVFFFSATVGKSYGYESSRRIGVVDIKATSPERLEALRTEALASGEEATKYHGPAEGKVHKKLLKLDGKAVNAQHEGLRGTVMVWLNDAGSSVQLAEDVTFDPLQNMEVWTMNGANDITQQQGAGPFHVEVEPGETFLIFLKPTQIGLMEAGFGFGCKSSYMIKPFH